MEDVLSRDDYRFGLGRLLVLASFLFVFGQVVAVGDLWFVVVGHDRSLSGGLSRWQ
jgi:hypothetical protein